MVNWNLASPLLKDHCVLLGFQATSKVLDNRSAASLLLHLVASRVTKYASR